MTWVIIISLLLIGLILVLVEIIFVPGTTLVGIMGALFTGLGLYYAFQHFEYTVALSILGFALLANIGAIVYGFRSGVWKRFSLKETISSRAFDDRLLGLEVGQKGKALSDIKPYGKVEFGDKIYEVKSDSGFIPAGTEVHIHRLESNKIIIKQ